MNKCIIWIVIYVKYKLAELKGTKGKKVKNFKMLPWCKLKDKLLFFSV